VPRILSWSDLVIVLFVLMLMGAVAGAGLLAAMYRRDRPMLGLAGLGAMLVVAVLAAVYGTLDSI
jgi:hypothetical protein